MKRYICIFLILISVVRAYNDTTYEERKSRSLLHRRLKPKHLRCNKMCRDFRRRKKAKDRKNQSQKVKAKRQAIASRCTPNCMNQGHVSRRYPRCPWGEDNPGGYFDDPPCISKSCKQFRHRHWLHTDHWDTLRACLMKGYGWHQFVCSGQKFGELPNGVKKGYSQEENCYVCKPGFYSIMDDKLGKRICKKCPQNTYQPKYGQSESNACLPCPSHSFSPPGSTTVDYCYYIVDYARSYSPRVAKWILPPKNMPLKLGHGEQCSEDVFDIKRSGCVAQIGVMIVRLAREIINLIPIPLDWITNVFPGLFDVRKLKKLLKAAKNNKALNQKLKKLKLKLAVAFGAALLVDVVKIFVLANQYVNNMGFDWGKALIWVIREKYPYDHPPMYEDGQKVDVPPNNFIKIVEDFKKGKCFLQGVTCFQQCNMKHSNPGRCEENCESLSIFEQEDCKTDCKIGYCSKSDIGAGCHRTADCKDSNTVCIQNYEVRSATTGNSKPVPQGKLIRRSHPSTDFPTKKITNEMYAYEDKRMPGVWAAEFTGTCVCKKGYIHINGYCQQNIACTGNKIQVFIKHPTMEGERTVFCMPSPFETKKYIDYLANDLIATPGCKLTSFSQTEYLCTKEQAMRSIICDFNHQAALYKHNGEIHFECIRFCPEKAWARAEGFLVPFRNRYRPDDCTLTDFSEGSADICTKDQFEFVKSLRDDGCMSPCQLNPCKNDGKCVDLYDKHKGKMNINGHENKFKANLVFINNDDSTVDRINNYMCECKDGHSGYNCQVLRNGCLTNEIKLTYPNGESTCVSNCTSLFMKESNCPLTNIGWGEYSTQCNTLDVQCPKCENGIVNFGFKRDACTVSCLSNEIMILQSSDGELYYECVENKCEDTRYENLFLYTIEAVSIGYDHQIAKQKYDQLLKQRTTVFKKEFKQYEVVYYNVQHNVELWDILSATNGESLIDKLRNHLVSIFLRRESVYAEFDEVEFLEYRGVVGDEYVFKVNSTFSIDTRLEELRNTVQYIQAGHIIVPSSSRVKDMVSVYTSPRNDIILQEQQKCVSVCDFEPCQNGGKCISHSKNNWGWLDKNDQWHFYYCACKSPFYSNRQLERFSSEFQFTPIPSNLESVNWNCEENIYQCDSNKDKVYYRDDSGVHTICLVNSLVKALINTHDCAVTRNGSRVHRTLWWTSNPKILNLPRNTDLCDVSLIRDIDTTLTCGSDETVYPYKLSNGSYGFICKQDCRIPELPFHPDCNVLSLDVNNMCDESQINNLQCLDSCETNPCHDGQCKQQIEGLDWFGNNHYYKCVGCQYKRSSWQDRNIDGFRMNHNCQNIFRCSFWDGKLTTIKGGKKFCFDDCHNYHDPDNCITSGLCNVNQFENVKCNTCYSQDCRGGICVPIYSEAFNSDKKCMCPPNYCGSNGVCEYKMNEFLMYFSPYLIGSPTCSCNNGFIGSRCEIDLLNTFPNVFQTYNSLVVNNYYATSLNSLNYKNPCDPNPCENGRCVTNWNSNFRLYSDHYGNKHPYKCICSKWYKRYPESEDQTEGIDDYYRCQTKNKPCTIKNNFYEENCANEVIVLQDKKGGKVCVNLNDDTHKCICNTDSDCLYGAQFCINNQCHFSVSCPANSYANDTFIKNSIFEGCKYAGSMHLTLNECYEESINNGQEDFYIYSESNYFRNMAPHGCHYGRFHLGFFVGIELESDFKYIGITKELIVYNPYGDDGHDKEFVRHSICYVGRTCDECPPHSTSSGGKIKSCTCLPGEIFRHGECLPCPVKTYQEGDRCISCPTGKTAPANSTECVDIETCTDTQLSPKFVAYKIQSGSCTTSMDQYDCQQYALDVGKRFDFRPDIGYLNGCYDTDIGVVYSNHPDGSKNCSWAYTYGYDCVCKDALECKDTTTCDPHQYASEKIQNVQSSGTCALHISESECEARFNNGKVEGESEYLVNDDNFNTGFGCKYAPPSSYSYNDNRDEVECTSNLPCVCSKAFNCTNCPKGQVRSKSDPTQCEKCPPGQYRDDTMTECSSCSSGFMPSIDRSECIPKNCDNRIKHYEFVLQKSGTCDIPMSEEECRNNYKGTSFYVMESSNQPHGCIDHQRDEQITYYNTNSFSTTPCGDGSYGSYCFCNILVACTECPSGFIIINNKCVCPNGKVPNPNRTKCIDVPFNGVVQYDFIFVNTGTCESNGYITLDADGCTEYGNTLTYPPDATLNTWEAGTSGWGGYSSANGCTIRLVDGQPELVDTTIFPNGMLFYYTASGSSKVCGDADYSCVCHLPVSFELCGPGQIVENNACVQCDAWRIATSNGCQACPDGQVPNTNQTECVEIPFNGVVEHGFAFVSSGSCETNGYSVINQDECRDYHGDGFTSSTYTDVAMGCISGSCCGGVTLTGWNGPSSTTGVCGDLSFACVCRAPPVSYTECAPGQIVENNACVQCDAWKIATSNGCQACTNGQVPNANQSACVDVPFNGVINYGFAFVSSGSCETNGYSVINQDECRDYHGDGFTSSTYTDVAMGCISGSCCGGVTLTGWNGPSSTTGVCGDLSFACVCRAPPVSYTLCAPGQIVENNVCVQCDAWKIATLDGCQACTNGQVPNATQTGCVDVPFNGVVQYENPIVNSGTCEDYGYSVINQDECREFHGDNFATYNYNVIASGCVSGNLLSGWNGPSSTTGGCGTPYPEYCVCRTPPVSYTECAPGQIVENNVCVQCDAWKIATLDGCQACTNGQVPNANQSACVDVPFNGVVNYGFALVYDTTCELNGYTTLDADGCTAYGNTLTYPSYATLNTWEAGTYGWGGYSSSNGCTIRLENGLPQEVNWKPNGMFFFYTASGSSKNCGDSDYWCVCNTPPVSYTECAPGQIVENNVCVQCDAWEITTSDGCNMCPVGQVPNADQTACVVVPKFSTIYESNNKISFKCEDGLITNDNICSSCLTDFYYNISNGKCQSGEVCESDQIEDSFMKASFSNTNCTADFIEIISGPGDLSITENDCRQYYGDITVVNYHLETSGCYKLDQNAYYNTNENTIDCTNSRKLCLKKVYRCPFVLGCSDCPNGQHASNNTCVCDIAGGLEDKNCKCEEDHIVFNNTCIKCDDNQITDENQTECFTCEANTYESENKCISCPLGKVSFPGEYCTDCPAGKYRGPNDTECVNCGKGYYSSSSSSECTAELYPEYPKIANQESKVNYEMCNTILRVEECHNASIIIEPTLPHGCLVTNGTYYYNEYENTVNCSNVDYCVCAANVSLSLCPDYLQPSSDRLKCVCDAGKYEFNNSCIDCPEETYRGLDDNECRECLNNFAVDANQTQCVCNGIIENDVCKCPDQSNFNDNKSHCVCPDGHQLIDNVCTMCTGNTFKATGMINCEECKYEVNSDKTLCMCEEDVPLANGICQCGEGQIFTESGCQACLAGSFSNTTHCLPCGNESYSFDNSSSCSANLTCNNASYPVVESMTSYTCEALDSSCVHESNYIIDCVECQMHHYNLNGICVPCPENKFRFNNYTSCEVLDDNVVYINGTLSQCNVNMIANENHDRCIANCTFISEEFKENCDCDMVNQYEFGTLCNELQSTWDEFCFSQRTLEKYEQLNLDPLN